MPRSSLGNVEAILGGDAAYAGSYFRYDSFSGKLFYGQVLAADHIDTTINIDIERRYGFSSRTTLVQEAILKVANENAFHPVLEYLGGLTWDGVPRLDALLENGFGAVGNREFLAEAGTKFAIGAVARICAPGCQMDNMLVLTGQQGVGKSTGLRVLSNGWFADSPLPVGDKDSYMQLAGRWFYEISELDSFRKAENTRIKAFISSRFDSFRPPFGRHVVERPRQTILVGTTNEDQFLTDPTGSRRFVPIRVTKVNLAWLTEYRDQVWAEALVRYQAGEIWHYEGESALRLARESVPYQQGDPWEQPVLEYLQRRRLPTVTALDVLTGCIGVSLPHITRQERSRVTQLLRMLGCEEIPVADGQDSRVVWTIPKAIYLAAPVKPTAPAAPFWKPSNAAPKAEA
jgi:putative DNA primase/helicase